MRRTITWIAAALAAVAFADQAQAQVFDDNPAAASRGTDDVHVFTRANGGSIFWRSWTNTGWSGWRSLDGNFTSGPTAVAYGTAIQVFARGTNGETMTKSLVGGTWTGWSSIGGISTSAPSATLRRGPEGYVDVAIKGTDNQIYLRTFQPGYGWHPWGALGGALTSAPALNSQADGILNVFARGTDCAVWQKSWTPQNGWTDWFSLGGCIQGAPTVVSRGPNQLDLYARGTDRAIYQRHWDSTNGWTGWFQLDPTPVLSAPGVVSDNEGREILFAGGGRGLQVKTWYSTAGWTAWNDFGPIEEEAPAAPPAPGPAPAPTIPNTGVGIETGVRCTPVNGLLRVNVAVRKPKGGKKARVQKIVFFTRGKNRAVRVDRRAPFQVRIRINRPAGSKGRVYARIYYKRSARGKVHRKTVSRRYTVCR